MESSNDSISKTILYILAWLVCSVLVLADVLIVRQATLDVMSAVQVQRVEASQDKAATRINAGFVKEMVDRVIIITGGIAAVSLSLYLEYYFRKGKQLGRLMPRIGKALSILLGVLLVGLVIQLLV